MNSFTQNLTVMGIVEGLTPRNAEISVRCQSGDIFQAFVTGETVFNVLRNLDGLDNDRVAKPGSQPPSPGQKIEAYLSIGQLAVLQGVWQLNGTISRYDARAVWVLASAKDKYLFEETHWWLNQTSRLADQWLDSLFGSRRDYALDDFVKLYQTDLNISGLPLDDEIQECAVLSRLIYGFSAAYLLTGQERYRKAAATGVSFQRDAFRSLSHDGKRCFWAFGRRKRKYGTELLVPSTAGDDAGSIPLYEQIYALAGLTHFYRISLNSEVLDDIWRTVRAFNDFYLDVQRPGDAAFTGQDGWFSHVDYATLRPDMNLNPANNLKKNWNSIGDHIPAYLVNLILTLDPLPQGNPNLAKLLELAREMLERATRLILDKFADKNSAVPYVNERFLADWTPDHSYSWQQNRAIIGHNFKIAWNLTRVANYYESMWEVTRDADPAAAAVARDLASRSMEMARRLGEKMTEFGIDQIRGGCFDAVERNPANGLPLDFTWMNTKDFWQQEQAILAYLILYGHLGDPLFLDMARRTEAYWNLFFLDRDHRGVYFRVTENGQPILDMNYGVRGGHSDASGYHCFELAYLAHIYDRAYVAPRNGTDPSFCLYFQPDPACELASINVLPDFMQPGKVSIRRVTVDGVPRPVKDPYCFQIDLAEGDLGKVVAVEFVANS